MSKCTLHDEAKSAVAKKEAENRLKQALSHNADLAMWSKMERLSSACKLCGKRQTLLHVTPSLYNVSWQHN